MARLGDFIREENHPLGALGAKTLRLIGVSNEHGLHASSRDTADDLARYQRIERDWFAYNPMRVNVGSIGLADDDTKTGFTSPDYVVFSCRAGLDPHYLLHFLKSDYGLEAIGQKCSGAVRKRLYFSGLAEIELPVPDLSQQRAAVARIDKINETIHFIREENSDRHELPQLQQAILQEAIQGKLTAAWRAAHPDAEPASQLLRRIQAEKARLIAAKKLRPEKPLHPIPDSEIPFDIPEGWSWCRFGDVQLASDAGSSPKCDERPVIGSEWGILKVSATSGALFRQFENKFFQTNAPTDDTSVLREGDFILSRANTKELAGNSVIVEGLTLNLLLSDKTVRFRFSENANRAYANLVNKAAFVRAHFIDHATGTSPSMKNLSRDSINSHLFPLPPLAEQAEIVARVEGLMAGCRALEGEIAQARAQAAHLLQAVLREAFAPAAVAVVAPSPRHALKTIIYLLQFIPALARASNQPLSLDRLNAAVALLFLPKADLLPLLGQIAGPASQTHFASFDQPYDDGAFLAAVQTLLKTKTLVLAPASGDAPTFTLTHKLPPIAPEIDADARHLAPVADRLPVHAVASSLPRRESTRVREELLTLV